MTRYIRPDLVIANNDGTPTREFIREWNALVDQVGGQGRDFVGETKDNADGIIAGTKQIADVQITNLGRLTNIIEAQESNIDAATSTAGAGGALTATADPKTITGVGTSTDPETVTTTSTVITATGGTAPYTCVITKKNVADDDIPPINANPVAGGAGLNEFTVTHQKLINAGDYFSSNYCATITDSAGSPASFEVCYTVTVANFT